MKALTETSHPDRVHRHRQRPVVVPRRVMLKQLLGLAAIAGGADGGFADAPGAAAATLKLVVRPAAAIPGAFVTVTGSGFPSRATGRLSWGSPPAALGGFRTDEQGRFSKSARAPQIETSAIMIVGKVGKRIARARFRVQNPGGAPVSLGIYQPNAPGDGGAMNEAEELLGRAPAIYMWYQAWGFGPTRGFDPNLLKAAASRGAVPMITWEPWVPNGSAIQPDYRLSKLGKDGNDGFGEYIASWAAGLAAYDGPVYLRFAHEMNGSWYPWAPGVNGNNAGDFKTAWQRVHTRLMDAIPAGKQANIRWVWSPNIEFDGSTDLRDLYPGDDFVDWVGIDGYNWGTSRAGERWKSFSEVFGATLNRIQQVAPNKPVMIAETASSEDGGNKDAWIEQALLNEIPLRFPAVRTLIWFNETKETSWRIDSSPGARAAFIAAARNPYYDGKGLVGGARSRNAGRDEADTRGTRDDGKKRPKTKTKRNTRRKGENANRKR